MTPIHEMTDDELQREWSAAQFFYNSTGTGGGSLETTMHIAAEERIAECEAEMTRRDVCNSQGRDKP